MNLKKVFLLLLFLASSYDLYSLTLTLDECIKIAQSNSPQSKIAKSKYLNSYYSYQAFKSGFLPQISFSGSAPGLVRQINQITLPDGSLIYQPQSYLSSTAGLYINQKIPWTGGNISASSSLSRIDISGTNDTYYWLSTPIQLVLSQPLFRQNSFAWNMEIEKLNNNMNDKQFIESMEDIAIEATDKFFNVYIQQINVKNAQLNVDNNDTLYVLSKGRYEVGKIAENDLLQSELALMNSQNQLENAQLNYSKAKEELLIYLNLNPKEELTVIPQTEISFLSVDNDKAMEEAKKNRSDISNYKLNELTAQRNLELARDNNNFSANISASFGLNQTAGKMDQAYKSFLDKEQLSVSFEIPLFQFGRGSSEVEAALAAKELALSSNDLNLQYFEMNVKYQTLQFNLLQEQVKISAKTDTIASRRFEVAKNRYLIGKIDLNSLFIAQNEKDAALSTYMNTLRNYWIAYYNIRRSTLYDFVRNQTIEHHFK
ncbi:MAG: TolC family protein [Ignavibacteria bacterium]|nr:TolC family protein [Ignavibacteria bacterium]